MTLSIDQIDKQILRALQKSPMLTQRALADTLNLSQNTCWRRLKALTDAGILEESRFSINREALGLDLVVFVMIKTRHHSDKWLAQFKRNVETIPEVVDFFRIGGDHDYMLKIVTTSMKGYDSVYQRLIRDIELDTVTSYFAMEGIFENRGVMIE
ncbi:MAG: Lrp/AsnC family transcriptional regulator [Gammaproteobacteria bacterium]|nr:Lrp/AsnC family transcriptional regulator [Gammaproteobacteria bacterium]